MTKNSEYHPFPQELTDARLRHLINKKAGSDTALRNCLLTQMQMTVPFLRDSNRLGNTDHEMAKLRMQARMAGKQAQEQKEKETDSHPLLILDNFFQLFQNGGETRDVFIKARIKMREEAEKWKKNAIGRAMDLGIANDLPTIAQRMGENYYIGGYVNPLDITFSLGDDIALADQVIRESGGIFEGNFESLVQMNSNYRKQDGLIIGVEDESGYSGDYGVETDWQGIRMRVNYFRKTLYYSGRGAEAYQTKGINITFELSIPNCMRVYTEPSIPPVE